MMPRRLVAIKYLKRVRRKPLATGLGAEVKGTPPGAVAKCVRVMKPRPERQRASATSMMIRKCGARCEVQSLSVFAVGIAGCIVENRQQEGTNKQ